MILPADSAPSTATGIVYVCVDISPARLPEIPETKIVVVVPLTWVEEYLLTPQEIILTHHAFDGIRPRAGAMSAHAPALFRLR